MGFLWDYLPTVAELTDTKIPAGVPADGHSLATFLKGGVASEREYFYGELHEGKPIQTAR